MAADILGFSWGRHARHAEKLMDTIFENAELRVSFEAGSGDSDEIIMAFTGVRHALAGIDKDDFVKTNRSSRVVRDAYYINDLRRSWYNGIRQGVIDVLSPRIEGRRVVTLGNSLGGFGALMFSGVFETCDVAIAFAPQYSVRRELAPFENRWEQFSTRIDAFENDTCFLPGVDYTRSRKFIFCGATDGNDMKHADLIARTTDTNAHVFAIAGCGHDVSFTLKEKSLLGNLIDAAIDTPHDIERIGNILTVGSVAHASHRIADC
jgi:hypothetical protein